MKRGELYRIRRPTNADPKKQRVLVVVSRQALINSSFSTVVCAPIYSNQDGLFTRVSVGTNEGLKHDSSIHCDALVSISKSALTSFVGKLSDEKIGLLDQALAHALDRSLLDEVLE